MTENFDLMNMSPMLRNLIIENVLEKDPDTFDPTAPLEQEEQEKVLAFLVSMELQRKHAPRSQRRKRVQGIFSNQVRAIYRSK